MKLTYFSGEKPNFGDELNLLMWDALIQPGFFDDDESTLFLGIGSILWDYLPSRPKKIVMGSGYGGYTVPPNVHDKSWDIAFVRGPRTAKALNIDPKLAISDAAILTRFISRTSLPKKHKVSFMPHFQSIPRGHWQQVCLAAGINYIDPTDPDVNNTLNEISQSELMLTEAMHGAILADTLRVPWIALKPLASLHQSKWFDWSESLNINLQFQAMPHSSFRDMLAGKSGRQAMGTHSVLLGNLLSFTHSYFIDNAAKKLNRLAQMNGQLSDDNVFNSKSQQALERLAAYCDLKV